MFGKDRSKSIGQEIEAAKETVKEDPTDLRALHKLGELYNKDGQTDKALETYIDVARRYAAEEAHPKAIAVYKQALKLKPSAASIYEGMARSCALLLRTSEALEYYQTASQLHERAGQPGSALEVIQGALDHIEGNTTLWARLGALHAARGEVAEAVMAYEESLQLAESQQQWSDCLLLAERLLQVSPEHLGAFRLAAFAALERRDPMRALGWLRKAFRIHRDDEVILEMMADAFALIGQIPKTVTLLLELAQKHAKAGDADLAREFYERVLSHDRHNADAKQGLLSLSNNDADWSSLSEDDWVEEVEDPLEGNDTFESVPTIGSLQGRAQVNSGIFPASTTISPDIRDFTESLTQANTCLKYELYDRTAELLQQILLQAPEHIEARELHAKLLTHQDQPEAAAKVWWTLANETSDPQLAQYYLQSLLALDGISRDFRSIASHMLRQFQYAPPTVPGI